MPEFLLPEPPARPGYGEDGEVHIFSAFGDSWCMDEIDDDGDFADSAEFSGETPAGYPGDWEWHALCLRLLTEEGFGPR